MHNEKSLPINQWIDRSMPNANWRSLLMKSISFCTICLHLWPIVCGVSAKETIHFARCTPVTPIYVHHTHTHTHRLTYATNDAWEEKKIQSQHWNAADHVNMANWRNNIVCAHKVRIDESRNALDQFRVQPIMRKSHRQQQQQQHSSLSTQNNSRRESYTMHGQWGWDAPKNTNEMII